MLALLVTVLDRVRLGRFGWRGGALLVGALAGFALQFAQLHRGGAMIAAIDQYNRADVVFTALLPFAEDRAALLTELGIDPACAIYSDHHAWEFPDMPENVCAGLSTFTRGRELATLLRHPGIALRLAGHGVLGLDPWIAKNLGQVEGGDFAVMSPAQPGIGGVLHALPMLQLGVLALPLLALLFALRRPGPRVGGRRLDHAALTVATMAATLGITVLGDGLADVAKQGHLVVNAALAAWSCRWSCACRGASMRAAVSITTSGRRPKRSFSRPSRNVEWKDPPAARDAVRVRARLPTLEDLRDAAAQAAAGFLDLVELDVRDREAVALHRAALVGSKRIDGARAHPGGRGDSASHCLRTTPSAHS